MPQARHLVVQRGVDKKQRTGDVEQCVLVCRAPAIRQFPQSVALLDHHVTRHAQAHHAQGIGHVAQLADLRLQRRGFAARAQVHVQRVLDPQQFVLDRIPHRIQQRAVAAADAAARMFDLRIARSLRVTAQEHALVQAGFAAGGAQLVEQRQQHDRDVAMADLQPFQVIRQQHDAPHQRFAGVIAVGHRTRLQGLGQQFELLGHHRRRIQLHHAQGALHLVQVTGAKAHPAGIGGLVDECLDFHLGLAQRFVEFRLDPAQDSVTHGLAQYAHRHLRPADGWPRWARCKNIPEILPFIAPVRLTPAT